MAGAEDFPRATEPQILLGDPKSVIGLAHQCEPGAAAFAERLATDQQTGRLCRPPPYPAAQLVKLSKPEALGPLDHHQRGVGNIDPDLDHGRRHQHSDFPGSESGHHPVLVRPLHPTVDQSDLAREALCEQRGALLGGRGVAGLAFFDQRADPIGLAACFEVATEAVDDFGKLFVGDDPGFNRSSAGWHLVEPADVHLAILGQRQRSRNWGRGHHQQVRRALGLARQQQSLRDAEAVLFVDHREAETAIVDLFLEDGVGADENVDRPIGEAHQGRVAHLALVAPGQDRDPDTDGIELPEQRRMMLPGENLGRGEQCGLSAGLDRGEHREQGNQRLARADIALKQSEHRGRLRHISADFLPDTALSPRQIVRQVEPGSETAVPGKRDPAFAPTDLAEELKRKLIGENLVIGEALADLARRIGMGLGEGGAPPAPVAMGKQRRLDPFGKLGRTVERGQDQLAQAATGETLGQRVNRFAKRQVGDLGGIDDFGMNDLPLVAVTVEPTGDDLGLAERKLLLRPAGIIEIGERDDVAGLVRGIDPVRPPPARASGIERRHIEDDVAPDQRLACRIGANALDGAGGQVKQEVDGAGQSQPGERLGNARTDALQRLDFDEQWIEQVGTHQPALACFAPA